MEKEHHNILSYRTTFLVFLCLITLLFVSVGTTKVDLGIYTVVAALVISAIQASLVLGVYMHLQFSNRMFTIMVLFVLLLFITVVAVTFLDYLYR